MPLCTIGRAIRLMEFALERSAIALVTIARLRAYCLKKWRITDMTVDELVLAMGPCHCRCGWSDMLFCFIPEKDCSVHDTEASRLRECHFVASLDLDKNKIPPTGSDA